MARARADVAATADRVIRRAEASGDWSAVDAMRQPGYQRWSMDARWIEFACGCRAERVHLAFRPERWDPVIFEGLPEEAVYDSVCHVHEPEMNKRLGLGGYRTFAQWRSDRRPRLVR